MARPDRVSAEQLEQAARPGLVSGDAADDLLGHVFYRARWPRHGAPRVSRHRAWSGDDR